MSMNAAMETMLVMRMQTAPTPKVLTFVPARKDILGTESHAKVHHQISIRTLAHFRLLLLSDKANRPSIFTPSQIRSSIKQNHFPQVSYAYIFYIYTFLSYTYITEYVLFQTLTNAVRLMPLKSKTAIRMRRTLILRAHTTVLAILHILGMVLIVKVWLFFLRR